MDYVAICRHISKMIARARMRGENEFAEELLDARATFAHHQTLQDREGFAYLFSINSREVANA